MRIFQGIRFNYDSPDGLDYNYEEDEEWLLDLYQREEDVATQENYED